MDVDHAPRVKDVYKFLHAIFKAEKVAFSQNFLKCDLLCSRLIAVLVVLLFEQLPAECAILCLAYVERLISLTNVTMHSISW